MNFQYFLKVLKYHKYREMYKILIYLISTVWIINGLFCKVLNLVPRHEQIVSRVIGRNYSHQLTILIGILEILMVLWILSNIKPKLNVIFQIIIVTSMNLLEFLIASDLLLWGRFNSLFAIIFILIVYFNHFYINKKSQKKTYVTIS